MKKTTPQKLRREVEWLKDQGWCHDEATEIKITEDVESPKKNNKKKK